MKKSHILAMLVVGLALILGACAPTSDVTETPGLTEAPDVSPTSAVDVPTEPVETEPAASPVVTDTSDATQMPEITETPAMTEPPAASPTVAETQLVTGTAVIPPTGFVDPGRASNLLEFGVYNQNNEQIGEVDDLVLSMEDIEVKYVVVDAPAADRLVAVPWEALMVVSAQAQTGTSGTTTGPANDFVLSVDQSAFEAAPIIDMETVPALGEPAEDWDAEISAYWEGIVPESTAATPTPTLPAQAGIQGVALASDLLNLSFQAGADLGEASVDDILVETDSGAIQYVVVHVNSSITGELLLPIPLAALNWDTATQSLGSKVDLPTLLQAPTFLPEEFPITQVPDWDAELRNFWQTFVSP